MRDNIVKFKDKKEQFKDWVADVMRENFEGKKPPSSAILLWEEQDDDGCSTAHCVHFDCSIKEWRWYNSCFGDKVREMEFDKWLREHINDYIEYVD